MAYKEPGAYLSLVNNSKYASGYGPQMIPLIIGDGARNLARTDSIVKAEGLSDTLPVANLTILSIGDSLNADGTAKSDYSSTNDYTPAPGTTITWKLTGSPKVPVTGATYYVTYTYAVTSSQFEPVLCTSEDDVQKYFGDVFTIYDTTTTNISPVALGARLVLEQGAPAVYVQQVEPNSTTHNVTSVEYTTALAKYTKFLPNVWRIVPMDLNALVNAAVDLHINAMSTIDERMERSAIYGSAYTEAPTDGATALTEVGTVAAGKANKRIIIPYPDIASKQLSDGKLHDLTAQYIAASYAGFEAANPVQLSKTRAAIKGYASLKGAKLTRVEKNNLAEKGVMVLTQPAGYGGDIVVRHQLTTDMTSVQTRETSVVAVGDYCAKYLRSVCEQYIGKYNITGETIAKVTAALTSAMGILTQNGVITKGTVNQVAQDELNPDTLIVNVDVYPPYPCNYIKITMMVD